MDEWMNLLNGWNYSLSRQAVNYRCLDQVLNDYLLMLTGVNMTPTHAKITSHQLSLRNLQIGLCFGYWVTQQVMEDCKCKRLKGGSRVTLTEWTWGGGGSLFDTKMQSEGFLKHFSHFSELSLNAPWISGSIHTQSPHTGHRILICHILHKTCSGRRPVNLHSSTLPAHTNTRPPLPHASFSWLLQFQLLLTTTSTPIFLCKSASAC